MGIEDISVCVICIALTLALFWLSRRLAKLRFVKILPPLVLSAAFVIILIETTPLSYETYAKGTAPMVWLLAPATVALAYPLYNYWGLVKNYAAAILASVIAGGVSSVVGVYLFALLFGLEREIAVSLLPKSVTTPVALEISKHCDGILPVTLCAVVITGTFGAAIGHRLLRAFGVRSDAAIGLSLGSTSHVIGTAKCLEQNPAQGAFGALVIVLAGIFTALLIPLFLVLANAFGG